jgi:Flp pilus assembly protein protease CpaA
MHSIQLLFTVFVMLILAGLLVDGLLTRAVWVKGARNGLFSFRHWAHKCERDEESWPYWFAMGFYALALLCLGGLLLWD